MLKDLDGNNISIDSYENHSELIIGKSGFGKTFYVNRRIEEYAKNGIPVLILDFSGSYTMHELQKAKLDQSIPVQMISMHECLVDIRAGNDSIEVAENLTDSLGKVLGDIPMMQMQILQEACEKLMQRNGYVSFQNLFQQVGAMAEGVEETRYLENIDFLRKRLYYMRRMESPHFVAGPEIILKDVTIWQISEFSEQVRRTLAQCLLEVMWTNTRQGEDRQNRQLILDEFQFLELRRHTALDAILTEGRRFGLGTTLITQYLRRTEICDSIQQAATTIYFRPNDNKMDATAKLINAEDYNIWAKVLKQLKRGEAVLSGKYTVNNNISKVLDTPIVVSVHAE